MLEKNVSSFKLIKINDLIYVEGQLDTPFSGFFNYIADDGSRVKSIYKNGYLLIRINSENNIIKSKVKYKSPNRKEVLIYDDKGKLEAKNEILNNKLDGLSSFYSEGILSMTVEFKEGKRNGSCIIYDTNGLVSDIEYYINDIKHD